MFRPLDDVIHPLSEFAKLPWSSLDPERCTRDWSFGRGGHGFNDQTMTVSIIHPDGSADIWELPPQLAAMFKVVKQIERDETRRKIRCALGINT